MRIPILFDVTRLYSRRFNSNDTGIDRIERGLFEQFSVSPENRFLVRYGRFYFSLRAENFEKLLKKKIKGKSKNISALWRAAELTGYKKIKPSNVFSFVHVGHTEHGKRFWDYLDEFDIKSYVLIHDVIPLDYPQYCREDQVGKFSLKFDLWAEYAQRVIAPSEYTASRIVEHGIPRIAIDVVPNTVVPFTLSGRYPQKDAFLVLGTIEPRKNHMMLFRLWEDLYSLLGEKCPKLWIIGARGWDNKEVFEFMDSSPLMGKYIFELGALSDKKMMPYFEKAKAVLFPSFVEGFGIPLYEAILAQKPVIASNIPCFQEAVDDSSQQHLVHVDDFDGWKRAILKSSPPTLQLRNPNISNWKEYVSIITKL